MIVKWFRGARVSFVLILALALGVGGGLARDAAAKQAQWVAAWGFSIQGRSPTLLNNQTVRMIARPTVSGSAVRVLIDNFFGTSPLVVGSASFAVRNNGAQLAPATTADGHDPWHDILSLRRLLDPGPAAGPKADQDLGFVNEGIGGNRVTVTVGQGSPAAVQRLDRDVLERTGIGKVVFFEGTNDLGSGQVNADQLMAGMMGIIDRVHARRPNIAGAPAIPRSNATWTAQMTAYRHQVNDWILHRARFDGVIDFDKVMRDATNPDIMAPRLEFGDHIHPNPFGYLQMGQSINMSLIDRR